MLKGKFTPPRASRQLVERRRALDSLAVGIDLCLATIVAPAGYGKTTLCAQWRSDLIARGRSVAWLSLDTPHNDLELFITDLCAAFGDEIDLQTSDGARRHPLGAGYEGVAVILALLEDRASRNTELHIFLDNLHLINAPDILSLLSRLILESPSNIHFIVMSRLEIEGASCLNLGRLPAQAQVNSLDIGALHFDDKEAECLLKASVKTLPDAEILRKIMEVTEGWVTALQWAATLLSQSPVPADIGTRLLDYSSFSADFAAVDFISEATISADRLILAQKGERFMLQTSILEGFNESLARTLTGIKDCAEIIRWIKRQNFPLLPVEGQSGWYRYHPLFNAFLCDLLLTCYVEEAEKRARRLKESWAGQSSDAVARNVTQNIMQNITQYFNPPQMAGLLKTVGSPVFDLFDLHRRAAEWYYQMGMTDQAVHHYLSVNNVGSVVGLLEDCTMVLLQEGRMVTLMSLAARLPKGAFAGRYRLHLNLAWCYLLTCRTKEATQFLEGLAHDPSAMGQIHKDELAAAQNALKVFLDDSAGIKSGAPDGKSPDGKGKGEPFHIAAGCNAVIFSRIIAGDYEEGRRIITWVEQKPDLCSIYFPFLYRQCLLALIYGFEGQFEQSYKIASAALELAEQRKGRRSAPACVAVAVLSESLYEQNKLHSLRDLLANRLDVINESVYPDALIRAYTNGARTYWALQEPLKSAALLDTLYHYGEEKNHVRVMAASLGERLRQALTQHRLDLAEDLQNRLEALVPKGSPLTFDTAGELVLLVRLSRARLDLDLGYPERTIEILDSLLERYSTLSRRRLHARIYVMRATAKLKMGAYARALGDFVLALKLGEDCGLVRIFLDEPKACAMLLKQFSGSEDLPKQQEAYLEGILRQGIEQGIDKADGKGPLQGTLPSDTAGTKTVLSPKEMEIMHYLGQGLPNKRIALAMDISVETVRWHMKNIFSKLNVRDRHDATNRAKILNLI